MKTDFQLFSKELSKNLDRSIRHKLRKQGLTISQNIYTGFDTEYTSLAEYPVALNKLLSAQLAVTTRTRLKLPLLDTTKFEALEPSIFADLDDQDQDQDHDQVKDVADSLAIAIAPIEQRGSLLTDDRGDSQAIAPFEHLGSILFDDRGDSSYLENEGKSPAAQPSFDSAKALKLLSEGLIYYRSTRYKHYDESVDHIILALTKEKIAFSKSNDSVTFAFPFTTIRQFFHRTEDSSYTMKELVETSKKLVNDDLVTSKAELYEKLKEIHLTLDSELVSSPEGTLDSALVSSPEGTLEQTFDFESSILSQDRVKADSSVVAATSFSPSKSSRSWLTSFTGHRASVSSTTQIFLILHNSAADLSILSDFNDYKNDLTIVNKSYVTLGEPLKVSGMDVQIRDTQLIAPGGSKSLRSISLLYKDIPKLDVAEADITDMEGFWNRDKDSFIKYAEQDALITLIHGCTMDDFNRRVGGTGVPLTLSSLAGRFLEGEWETMCYEGYQISPKYLVGDTSKVQTPRGLHATNFIGLKLSYFIANFKGGRNETFMYGVDEDTNWYDYDLASAYTTVMAMIGDPDYKSAKNLTEEKLNSMA